MTNTSDRTQTVKLTRIGNSLMLSPWVPALEGSLKFDRREKQATWPFRYEVTPVRLFQVHNGQCLTFGGLYARVLRKLRELGFTVNVIDRQAEIPAADFSKLSGTLRAGQDVVLAGISVSHRGVIDCPTAFGKSFMITQIARIYPNCNILVVTPARAVIESLFKRLKEGTDRKVIQVRAGRKFNSHAEVVVCSARSLHHIPADWPGILLFDECHGAPASTIQDQLVRFGTCRMFGFSASPEGRNDGADLMVEAFFGPVLAHMPYSEAVRTGSVVPIQTYIANVNCPEIEVSTDIGRDRYGYWQNHVRNQKIASVAKQIPEDKQALILVKTTEHALRLQSLLPGWPVVHGGKSREDWAQLVRDGAIKHWATEEELRPYEGCAVGATTGLLDAFLLGEAELQSYTVHGTPDTTELREQFEAGTLKRAISTTMWKEGIDPVHLRWLIRADGASGNIPGTQIPGRLARTTDGKKAGILIDFLDNYGNRFYRRSQGRIRLYKKKEWRVHEDWDGIVTAEMGSV